MHGYTKYDEPTCCICQEIDSQAVPETIKKRYLITRRLQPWRDAFVVMPSVSPLSAGHLLVFPRRHVRQLAALSRLDGLELQQLAGHLVSSLASCFGPPYIFEHGASSAPDSACGIVHAHLHLVPLPADIHACLTADVERDFPADRVDCLSSVLCGANRSSAYLLYGSSVGALSLSRRPCIPSQLMRRRIAEKLGSSHWNWHDLSGLDEFAATLQSLTHLVPS